jgi:hypothetical protein
MNVQNTNHGRRAGARLLALALALSLAACGGGGGNPGTIGTGSGGGTGGGTGTGTGTGTTTVPTVALAFTNTSGQASNSLSAANQLTVKATVRDKAGAAVPNALVTFATDNTLAVFSPAAGTALTDANGVASVTMKPASLASEGAGAVAVTTNVSGTSISAQGNYSVGATALKFGTLTASDTSIQAYGSTTLSVDVLAGAGKYTDQQVNVNFSSDCVNRHKATLAAVVGTINGTAKTVYRDQGCGTSDVITVSATGVATPATTQLAIAPPAAASVQFESASPSDQSIVIQGQGGNGRTETATLKFRVVDVFSNPLPGQAVKFSASTAAVTVNKLSDTTDANGEVVTTVNSGTVATSFRVLATLPATASGGNPDISTWSDTIVVTTGLPVQRAFSLSAGKFNLDRTIDSVPTNPATTIQAMIADNFGNPVPDGTPVVFQTNMGSVGSSARGGCTTTNGGCAVDFRMQDPRSPTANLPVTPCNTLGSADSTRPGVATLCASTTDGTNTVYKNIYLFFSGNTPDKVYMDGARLNTGVATDLGAVRADASRVFTIQVNDNNDNPLPAGTSLSVVNLANAVAGAALPGSVASIAPAGAPPVPGGMPQGSSHMFTITSSKPTGCTADLDATFSVAVTTPAGVSSYIPFKLRFSCP